MPLPPRINIFIMTVISLPFSRININKYAAHSTMRYHWLFFFALQSIIIISNPVFGRWLKMLFQRFYRSDFKSICEESFSNRISLDALNCCPVTGHQFFCIISQIFQIIFYHIKISNARSFCKSKADKPLLSLIFWFDSATPQQSEMVKSEVLCNPLK